MCHSTVFAFDEEERKSFGASVDTGSLKQTAQMVQKDFSDHVRLTAGDTPLTFETIQQVDNALLFYFKAKILGWGAEKSRAADNESAARDSKLDMSKHEGQSNAPVSQASQS